MDTGLQNFQFEAGEMAQWIKHSLGQRDNLSSTPQHPDVVMWMCNQRDWRQLKESLEAQEPASLS